MKSDPILLPTPRHINLREGQYQLNPERLIRVTAPRPERLLAIAMRVQAELKSQLGLHWQITTGFSIPSEKVGLELRLAPGETAYPQGYRLGIDSTRIMITAPDEAGLFYGAMTLNQIIRQSVDGCLPGLEITDWPDFLARGVMLDISRDKVPTLATLFELVDRLASWKINQLQLYTEHTFAYQNHPEVWAQASPMTGDDILKLDAFCRERFIELVPNQNSFGHLTRWLVLPRYAPLAEIHGDFTVPWGTMHGPFSLAPVHPGSIELVRDLFDELLPHFSSRMVNVGCDETFDLGTGQSQKVCAERGVGRVYLDFLLQIYKEAARRGHQMQFWGDIINDHPELVPELPGDAIGLLWGYEADHPFDQQGSRFEAARVPFYVCPGTSSWNSIAGRTENALGNLLSAAQNGLAHGACGYLNTDWGDHGHWQAYPVAFTGYVAGAAYSWCLETNRELDVALAMSRHAFDDPSGTTGKLLFDLGNVYLASGVKLHNSSVLNRALTLSLEAIRTMPQANRIQVGAVREEVEAAMAGLNDTKMTRPDAELIRREIVQTGRLLRHAIRRIELAHEADPALAGRIKSELAADLADWLPEYRAIWLERNRPGGLSDSVRWFEEMKEEYR